MKNSMSVVFILVVASGLVACKSETASPENKSQVLTDPSVTEQAAASPSSSTTSKPLITVYKSPTCGCCKGWVTYLEEEGYPVAAFDLDDVDAIKTEHGLLDPALKSCHTAIVDGYVIEGHVPVNDIDRLLSERPKGIKGLTAPGMPALSPGMGSRTPQDYAVLSFTESGESSVYSQY